MNQLPPGWAEARLQDVAQIVRGVTYSKPEATTSPGEGRVPLLRATNIDAGGINLNDLYYVPATRVGPDQMLREGDIVVATSSGSLAVVGKSASLRMDWDGTYGAFCSAVRPAEGINARYLAHAVAAPDNRQHWSELARGSNINNLRSTHLAETTLRVAPLAEQERIVVAIEEAFSLLDAGETALHNTRTRLKRMHDSALDQAFKGLEFDQDCERICSEIVDCPHSTAHFIAEGLPCLDTTCMAPGRVLHERLRYVSTETWESRNRRLTPQGGDIVFAREGTIGTAVCLPEGFAPCLGQRVMLLRPGPSVLPRFLEQTLMAPQVKAQYAPLVVGSTAPHLNVRDVKRLRVPVPSLEVQLATLAELDRQVSFIEAAERAVDAALARATRLRRSVLKAAFEGRLVAQDPADEPASVLLERIAAERAAAAPKRRAPRGARGKAVAS